MAVPVRVHLLVGQCGGAALSLLSDIRFCLRPRCPLCGRGRLFRPRSVTVVDRCGDCGAFLAGHDVGDGAAVFLIFALGFTVVPLAWWFELAFAPPPWVHVALWGSVCTGLILLALPALKAYIILLQHRHRTPGQ